MLCVRYCFVCLTGINLICACFPKIFVRASLTRLDVRYNYSLGVSTFSAVRLISLREEGNSLGEEGKAVLRKAVEGRSGFKLEVRDGLRFRIVTWRSRDGRLHPPSYSTQARARRVRVVQTQRRHEYTALGTHTYMYYGRSEWSERPMSYLVYLYPQGGWVGSR